MAVLTPKSGIIGMNKKSALKTSSPYFTFKLISFKLKDHVRFEFWQFQGNQGIFRDYGPKFPNKRQGHLESCCNSSTSHFKSNEAQIKCRDHLRVLFLYIELHAASKLNFITTVQLLQSQSNWGIRAIWGYWDHIPQIMEKDTQKVI